MNLWSGSNQELLCQLFGEEDYAAYDGSLRRLFAPPRISSVQGASKGRRRNAPVRHQHLQHRCALARELVKRWLQEELQQAPVLGQPDHVGHFLQLHFAGQEHESFCVLFLDAQNRLIVAEELFRGTLTQTAVYPREVIKSALQWNAAGVILAHNHPSGVGQPSQADRQLTQTLKNALGLLDIQVLDHFIIAGHEVVSFARRGWL